MYCNNENLKGLRILVQCHHHIYVVFLIRLLKKIQMKDGLQVGRRTEDVLFHVLSVIGDLLQQAKSAEWI